MTKTEAKKANNIIRDIDRLNMVINLMKTNRGNIVIEKLKNKFILKSMGGGSVNMLDITDATILHEWAEISVEFFNNKIKEKEDELKNI